MTLSGFSSLAIGGVRFGYISILFILGLMTIQYTESKKVWRNQGYRSLIFPWLVFAVLLILSFSIDVFIFKTGHIVERLVIFDVASYSLLVLIIGMMERALRNGSIELTSIINWIMISYAIAMSSLLSIFLVSGPIPLVSADGVHFAPLVSNLHHTALASLVPLSLGMSVFISPSHGLRRWPAAAAMVAGGMSAYFSGSSKAVAGIAILALAAAVLLSARLLIGRWLYRLEIERLVISTLIAIAFLVPALHVAGVDIASAFSVIFSDLDTNSERRAIYVNAFARFSESPLLGFGPGRQVWAAGQWWDAHSSAAAILLQVGLLGAFCVALGTWRWFRAIEYNVPVLLAFSGFVTYGLFGDLHRNIPFWITLLLAAELSSRLNPRSRRKN